MLYFDYLFCCCFLCLLLLGIVSEFLLLFLLCFCFCLFVCFCCCFRCCCFGWALSAPLVLTPYPPPPPLQPCNPGSSIPYARSPEGELGGGSENAGRLPSEEDTAPPPSHLGGVL